MKPIHIDGMEDDAMTEAEKINMAIRYVQASTVPQTGIASTDDENAVAYMYALAILNRALEQEGSAGE